MASGGCAKQSARGFSFPEYIQEYIHLVKSGPGGGITAIQRRLVLAERNKNRTQITAFTTRYCCTRQETNAVLQQTCVIVCTLCTKMTLGSQQATKEA